MQTIVIMSGTEFIKACEKAWMLSVQSSDTVSFEFNGVVYVADAHSSKFTTDSTSEVAIDRIDYATKTIPIYGDPVISALEEQVRELQNQVRGLYSQIIQRKEVLMGDAAR